MTAAHARLAPSSAPEWGYCSGSVAASALAPQGETEETRSGDAAHWVGAECLASWKAGHTPDPVNQVAEYVGRVAPNGVVVDTGHAEGAAIYVDDVVSTLAPYAAGRDALLIEHRVSMPAVHATDNWGRLDSAAVLGNRIYLWDYKHGHSRVAAVDNLQQVEYMEGMRTGLGLDGHAVQAYEFDARVVQPNSYEVEGPVKAWRGMLTDIRGHINTLTSQAWDVDNNPTLTAGLHCKHCPARVNCPALRQSGYHAIDVGKLPVSFDRMNTRDLATERALLAHGLYITKARLDAVEDEIVHRLKAGEGAGSGLALGSSKGRLAWSVSPPQAIAAASLFGVDINKPACDTPTQARAKVPASQRALFDGATKNLTRRNSSVAIVDASDTLVARAFSNLKTTE